MDIRVVDNYQALSDEAAVIVRRQINHKATTVLGLATGSTPIGLYEKLVEMYQNGLDFSNILSFNLDEYVGLSGDHPASYRFYMETHLFSKINVRAENVHIPNGQASDILKECLQYEDSIRQAGGLDLQILGIGNNGHIGFNEPGTDFGKQTHVLSLTSETREANSRFFADDISQVPTKAISMGIKTIMRSKQILLLANGQAKADAVRQAVEGPVTQQLPASILQLHPQVTFILDKAAANQLS